MPRELDPPDMPGEDTVDLPRALCWLVAACTWLRKAVPVVGRGPGGRGSGVTALQRQGC